MSAWISNLPEEEKDNFLLRLTKGHDPHLGAELVQQYQQTISIKDNGGANIKQRIVEDLISKGERHAVERKRRIAEQAVREKARKERERAIIREKYLNDLAKRGDQVWKQVDELIKTKRQSDYDSVVQLLVDLRDLSIKMNKDRLFQEKLRGLREKHNRKPSFVTRLNKAGLDGQPGNS